MSALNLEYDLFSDTGDPAAGQGVGDDQGAEAASSTPTCSARARTPAAARDRRRPRAGAPGPALRARAAPPTAPARRSAASRPRTSPPGWAWTPRPGRASRPGSPIRCTSTPGCRSTSRRRRARRRASASRSAPPRPPPATIRRERGRRRDQRRPDSLSPAALTAAGGVSQAIAQQALSQSAAGRGRDQGSLRARSVSAGWRTPAASTQAARRDRPGPAGSGRHGRPAGRTAPVPQLSPDPRATSFGFGVPLRPLIPLPNRAAVALVHDVARGQTWPPPGTLGDRLPAGLRAGARDRAPAPADAGAAAEAGHERPRRRGELDGGGGAARPRPRRAARPGRPSARWRRPGRSWSGTAPCAAAEAESRARTEGGGFDA